MGFLMWLDQMVAAAGGLLKASSLAPGAALLAVGQNAHPLTIHVAWASSQHSSWAPKVSISISLRMSRGVISVTLSSLF